MKSNKKAKAAQKLKKLKETAVVEEENLLNAEISFNENVDLQSESNNDETDIVGHGNVRGEISLHAADEPGDKTTVASRHHQEESGGGDDGTMVLTDSEASVAEETKAPRSHRSSETTYREITAGRAREKETEKVSYGDVYENDSYHFGGGGDTVDGLLKKAEHLRIAQEKINDLENEIEDLRKQNHELSNDAESIATLNESYSAQIENLKMELSHVRATLGEEAKILRHSMYEKERLVAELKQSNADLKSKVETNFKSIRKRERDLEYRLELAKVDEAALLKSKDKMILDLRRELEKKDQEKTAFERKNKEHFQKIQEQQQTVRTVVRALRIALTRLEGDFGVDFEVLKKAE